MTSKLTHCATDKGIFRAVSKKNLYFWFETDRRHRHHRRRSDSDNQRAHSLCNLTTFSVRYWMLFYLVSLPHSLACSCSRTAIKKNVFVTFKADNGSIKCFKLHSVNWIFAIKFFSFFSLFFFFGPLQSKESHLMKWPFARRLLCAQNNTLEQKKTHAHNCPFISLRRPRQDRHWYFCGKNCLIDFD